MTEQHSIGSGLDQETIKLLRSIMLPGEKLIRFTSTADLDVWMEQDPRRRGSWRRSVFAASGIYLILHPVVRPQPEQARPPERRARAESATGWAVVAIVTPLLVVLGLLVWQPAWTLGTIAAAIALTVWHSARGGTFVEVLTRVRVRR